VELWELAARERIRDTLARYSWAGDGYRLDDLAAAFTEDGELEVRGQAPFRGRAAIVAFLSGGDGSAAADDEARRAARLAEAGSTGVRRVVRHLLTNTRFVEITPERASVSSYFTVITELGLDHHGRYRDAFVPAGGEWLIRHRFVSTDWRDPRSTMARASAVG
jgi:hypothetical protein